MTSHIIENNKKSEVLIARVILQTSVKGVLHEFQEFLLKHKLAQEKHVLFLAVWVSKFLAFSNRKGHQDLGLTVTEFLDSLEAKDDIKDWQLSQAGEAVRLYLNHFKGIQSAIGKAVKEAGILKHATVHTLRHSFATHLLMKGVNIREIQDLLGHKSVETTMIYTHVLRNMSNAPKSPLDALYLEK